MNNQKETVPHRDWRTVPEVLLIWLTSPLLHVAVELHLYSPESRFYKYK